MVLPLGIVITVTDDLLAACTKLCEHGTQTAGPGGGEPIKFIQIEDEHIDIVVVFGQFDGL